MATNSEALIILQAKQDFAAAIEAFTIELYFSPESVNSGTDKWADVLSLWETFRGSVTIVQPPIVDTPPEVPQNTARARA